MTIIHEKMKRKRGKAIYLYNTEGKEGQTLLFSPVKITRIRERVTDNKQAEE
jgi:hypothetical protein